MKRIIRERLLTDKEAAKYATIRANMSAEKENPTLAYMIRYGMGMMLNTNIEWTHPRLKEIALRQDAIQKEFEELDEEILNIARKYAKEHNIKLESGEEDG